MEMVVCLAGMVLMGWGGPDEAALPAGPGVPVTVVWGPGEGWSVALREGRKVVRVEPEAWGVTGAWELPFAPASLAVSADGEGLFVGGEDGSVARLSSNGVLRWVARVGEGAVQVAVMGDGGVVAAARWGREVVWIDGEDGGERGRCAVGFAPGRLLGRPEGGVIVAEAQGGRIASVRSGGDRPLAVRRIEGARIRGLGLSGDGRELLAAHIDQPGRLPLTRGNLDWGVVISSKLSAIRLTDLDRPLGEGEADRVHSRRLTLDGSGHGAADPAGVVVSPDGLSVVVAAAGAHQLLHIDRTRGVRPSTDLMPLGDSQLIDAIDVGEGAVGLAMDPGGEYVVSVGAYEDTLTVVRLESLEVVARVRLTAQGSEWPAWLRGERLFHDGRLALDRWMSCASCHAEGHTIGLNFDTRGDGNYGAAKNTPSLLGVGETGPYSWTGRTERLEDQVRESLRSSLHGPGVTEEELADLGVYLRSLAPAPGLRGGGVGIREEGAALFAERNCVSCHAPPAMTIAGRRDVGLRDGVGEGRFNPPSLRGVAWSAPYFHDGGVADLEEVLKGHHPGFDDPPGEAERAALRAYLESL